MRISPLLLLPFLPLLLLLLLPASTPLSDEKAMYSKILEDYERNLALSDTFLREGEFELAILLWTKFVAKIERLDYIPERIEGLKLKALEKMEDIRKREERSKILKGGAVSDIFQIPGLSGEEFDLDRIEPLWRSYIDSANGSIRFSRFRGVFFDLKVEPSPEWERGPYLDRRITEIFDRFGFKRAFKDSSIHGIEGAGVFIKGALKGVTIFDTRSTFPLFLSNFTLQLEYIRFRGSGGKMRNIVLTSTGRDFSTEEAEKKAMDGVVRLLFIRTMKEVVLEMSPDRGEGS